METYEYKNRLYLANRDDGGEIRFYTSKWHAPNSTGSRLEGVPEKPSLQHQVLVGLFSGDIDLISGDIDLFSADIGLFSGDIGLC